MAKKVLLVEDDFFIRDIYRIALEQKGLVVVCAVDGKEAIELFERELPDIVLLDIMLPELNGMAVLKFIRSKATQIGKVPVIMVTNLDSTDSMQKALDLGATEYWVKSLKDPMTVADQINHYVIGES